ncbi:kinase-like domain-containing protein [Mycena rebaudengoi]|nr:kinase-like domain-containing protein [Mycena rebaudengoi]
MAASSINQRLKRETEVWSGLDHPNVLPFLGVWDEPTWPALISPFYKFGDLGQYLRDHPTTDRGKMIRGVASGLEYLHRNDIVHGDLKIHNVVVDKSGSPCICDFGVSKIIDAQGFTTSIIGTVPYMAPELFWVFEEETDLEKPDRMSTSMSSDIYSFGLLVLEILTSNPPKHRPKLAILSGNAYRSLRPKRSDYDIAFINNNFWTLLDSCWEPDPTDRPKIGDVILRMPWDKSEEKISSDVATVPALAPAANILCGIIRICQKLTQNRFVTLDASTNRNFLRSAQKHC